jgi:DNA gyrase subunit A
MTDLPPDDGSTAVAGIEPIEIQEEMERSFLDYAMSVIVSRALPDARDGLKPVHRRILYGMYDVGARSDRTAMKCARVTGDVMGKYHPHGDGAIYDALVRMAQDFSLRHPLVDGHGNFGSPDHPAAAARYTECRLAPLANVMLDGIDENTVDFVDNYSGEFSEPSVLPSRFPNLLVNGSQGIAVGMATNIPPHNLGEAIDAVQHLIDHPEATPDDLMEFVKGPDFPTGALILGRAGILDAYRTGRGSIKMRARAEIDERKGATYIVVTELPYQASPAGILQKIADLVGTKDLDGIADVNDESAGNNTKLVIKLKRDANANVVLNNLYKHTPLQTSFGVNMVALVDGVPRTLNLVQILQAYVEHQVEVITRRSQYRLDKAAARAHIVEGLIKALDLIDEIIALIRASEDRAAARAGLMAAPFEFSETQAEHILDMRLSQLTRLARSDLDAELAKLRELIAELESILGDRGKLMTVIKTELGEVREKYATARRA